MKARLFSLQLASLVVFSLTLSDMSQANSYTSLEQLRWKHRLIIAFQNEQSLENTTLENWVRKHTCLLSQRDVVFLLIEDDRMQELTRVGVALDTNSIQLLTNNSNTGDRTSQFILIGKDGGIKARSEARLESLNAFLAQIDTMPMRQQEAQQQNTLCS